MAKNTEYINSMKEWDLEDIVDHVKSTHHAYLKANYPIIVRLLEKVMEKNRTWDLMTKENPDGAVLVTTKKFGNLVKDKILSCG